MKTLLSFLIAFTLTTTTAFAQNVARVMIEGQIIVPPGDEPDGIVVYNLASEKGTITARGGKFELAVALNDEILVQSLQYTPVTVRVDQGVLDSRRLSITLREGVTLLDEVVVSPYTLTGDVVADMKRVRIADDIDNVDEAEVVLEDRMYARYTPLTNIAMDDRTWKYGLNFVNIFKEIIGEQKKDSGVPVPADVELAQMYDNEFYKAYLNIEEENIGEFLGYVSENGLSKEMLETGNEFNLIKFLIIKSDEFKASHSQD